MANHVYFNIDLDISDKQVEKLREIMETAMEKSERDYGSGDPITITEWNAEQLPIYDAPYEEDNWYTWGCNNMGAKWVHIEEYDDYGVISGHSAWSHPVALVENLIKTLCELTEDTVSGSMTYEDEFRNFFGRDSFESYIYEDNIEMSWDENYIDSDEYMDSMRDKFGDQLDEEDFDWWEDQKDVDGNVVNPQEYADELVYEFFSSGDWNG